MNYIIVNGPPTAGKDTFCEMCISILEARGHGGQIVSSVAFVKEIAEKCGWDGTKTPKNRKFLSDLKDLLTEWDNIPMRDVIDRAEAYERHAKGFGADEVYIFVMMREPTEIEKFVDATGAKTLIISRDNIEKQINHADNDIYNYNYDLYVDNNGTLDDLHDAAVSVCDNFLNS